MENYIDENVGNAPTNAKTEKRAIDIWVFIALAYWLTSNLVNTIIKLVAYDWYDTPLKYVQVATNLIFALTPIIFALTIRRKALKIVAIIISALLTLQLIYGNIEWVIQMARY